MGPPPPPPPPPAPVIPQAPAHGPALLQPAASRQEVRATLLQMFPQYDRLHQQLNLPVLTEAALTTYLGKDFSNDMDKSRQTLINEVLPTPAQCPAAGRR